jgi:hypothetical protein
MAICSAHLVLIVKPDGQIQGIGIFSESEPTILGCRMFSLFEAHAPTYEQALGYATEELGKDCYSFGGELKHSVGRGLYRQR